MKPENLEIINQSFEIQAQDFESRNLNFTKEEYLHDMLFSIMPDKQDRVLEVAAGTCACGRSFSPLVQSVVCLDATAPMLQIGKQEAEKQHLDNMMFVKGYAEELPFLDNSFSIVFSRLAFHHFTDINKAFSEMVRVLKPNGKLILIDMEAADEALRNTEDEIETLRDISHIRNLSLIEMQELFNNCGLHIEKCETTEIEQQLTYWLNLTNTPEAVRSNIIDRMQREIDGQEKTGFAPYKSTKGICFRQKWVLTVGRKQQSQPSQSPAR